MPLPTLIAIVGPEAVGVVNVLIERAAVEAGGDISVGAHALPLAEWRTFDDVMVAHRGDQQDEAYKEVKLCDLHLTVRDHRFSSFRTHRG